ncbi:MAG: ATP-binding protein [Methyloceanibacter sp.]|jgi:anti-sigma regulatory factor (Ser/Thr protein kinase)
MPSSRQELRPNCWHRVFSGAILEIPSAASWIESIAADLHVPEPQAFGMQVCLEELMSNILRHGRGSSKSYWPQIDPSNPLLISITVEAHADRITMTVEDNGRPFNVAQAPAKAIDPPLERVEPGGLGIHLIKNFASNLQYSRTERGNRVIVEFEG